MVDPRIPVGVAQSGKTASSPTESQVAHTPSLQPQPQILLVLVGLPGSGKTTLAEALVRSFAGQSLDNAVLGSTSPTAGGARPWVRASQDDAPSRRRQECEAVVSQALMAGCNVVVDRVDFDPVQRSHFIRLARSLSLPVRPMIYALTLVVSPASLASRLNARSTHPTLTTPEIALQVLDQMMREWDPPRPGRREGFDRVLEVQERDQPPGGVWTGEGITKLLADFERWGHLESGEEWNGRSTRGVGAHRNQRRLDPH